MTNKITEFHNLLFALIDFDVNSLDVAKIIHFNKKDCVDEASWYSVIVDGLGTLKTHPETKFDVKITSANYSDNSKKYEMTERKICGIKGRKIASHFFNKFIDVNFSDLVKIEASISSNREKPYNISCVFARTPNN